MNVLADNKEDKNIDANLFLKFLLSSGAPDDNKITKLDSECLNISSNVLLEYPEQFYSIFFQGFTNPDGNHFKVMN